MLEVRKIISFDKCKVSRIFQMLLCTIIENMAIYLFSDLNSASPLSVVVFFFKNPIPNILYFVVRGRMESTSNSTSVPSSFQIFRRKENVGTKENSNKREKKTK
jgi:hypothetical protein